MLPLYPEIKPYARHMVEVDGLHQIYVDERYLRGHSGAVCSRWSRQRM